MNRLGKSVFILLSITTAAVWGSELSEPKKKIRIIGGVSTGRVTHSVVTIDKIANKTGDDFLLVPFISEAVLWEILDVGEINQLVQQGRLQSMQIPAGQTVPIDANYFFARTEALSPVIPTAKTGNQFFLKNKRTGELYVPFFEINRIFYKDIGDLTQKLTAGVVRRTDSVQIVEDTLNQVTWSIGNPPSSIFYTVDVIITHPGLESTKFDTQTHIKFD